MRIVRVVIPIAAFGLSALSLLVGSSSTPVAASVAVQAVDSSECLACHEDSVGKLGRTYHGAESCDSCHIGAAEHLQAQVEDGDAPAPTVANLKAGEINEMCLSCHENTHPTFEGSPHDRRGVSCVSCHGIHSFESEQGQLKTARASETCYSCHPAIRAKMQRTSHHPVREGVMGCEDCHNPHDGSTPAMIKANFTNDLCYECHTEKRGPFLWEHAPVREDCTNCHDIHGSNHDKLLVAKQPYLCQRCHLNTRHPGTFYTGLNAATDPANASNRAVEHACKNCHQNVHGSNAPSGPYLGR